MKAKQFVDECEKIFRDLDNSWPDFKKDDVRLFVSVNPEDSRLESYYFRSNHQLWIIGSRVLDLIREEISVIDVP
jgi:hypothetical protein